ncbi:hypothetical protein [Kitasatospora camelliae]|uniref:Integral membrane protein n=1 Tax=Kitasatospora camelliae TaxID=3156397 RepID=A0AAU8JW04_9ACTN
MRGNATLARPAGRGGADDRHGAADRDGPDDPGRAGRRHRRAPSRLLLPVTVAAGCQIVLLLWWLAAYPAFLGPDAVETVRRVTEPGAWTAGRAVPYDAAVLLSLRLTGGLAAVTLLQTAAAALTLGYAVAALARLGVRGRWSAPTALALAALPPTGGLTVFLWREVPFTLAAVLTCAACLRLLARRAAQEERPTGRGLAVDLAVLLLALLGLGLFGGRAGCGIAFTVTLALLAFLPGLRRQVALLALAALLVPLLLDLRGYRALLDVRRAPAAHRLDAADLAVAYHSDPTAFGEADTALFAAVAPLPVWDRAGAACYSADRLTDPDQGWDETRALARDGELTDLWFRTAARHPDLVLAARLCRGHLAWGIWPGPADAAGQTVVQTPRPSPDLYGYTAPGGSLADSPVADRLRPNPALTPLRKAAVWLHTALRAPQLEWLLWRGAVWTYLGYAALLVCARRRALPAALPVGGAVLIGLQLALIASGSGPDYRGMAAALFLGPLLLTLLTARRR